MNDLADHLSVPLTSDWEYLFYEGDRLLAEVVLLAASINKQVSSEYLISGSLLLRASHGGVVVDKPVNSFARYQSQQPEPKSLYEALQQFLVADIPDALLFWTLHRKLPSCCNADPNYQLDLIRRLLIHLLKQA